MDSLTLAVLSDLHVGYGARAKDLCPYPDGKQIESGYRERFIKFVRKQKFKPDYLIIPGDISDRAQPLEFELASELIVEMAATLNVDKNRILFVPGNHDVDWAVMNIADPTDFRRNQRYAPLQHQPWLFAQIMSSAQGDILKAPYFSLWEFDDLFAVGYNSAWHDDAKYDVHHGLISEEHLQDLDIYLDKFDLNANKLRVFLVHHHPLNYREPLPDTSDFSSMTNAEGLLKLLQKYKFDVLIHGHKHKPNFGTYSINAGFPIAILGSGSFSSQLDPRWSGYVNNQFHLLKIEGRDRDHQSVFGLVESWTYLCGHGWRPSEENNGIRYLLPFGTYVQRHQLLKAIRPILKGQFKRNSYVLWSTLVGMLPQLQYLPPERTRELIDSLGKELKFRSVGEPPDEVVLLK